MANGVGHTGDGVAGQPRGARRSRRVAAARRVCGADRAPGRRMIPGLGMSMRPPLLDESYVD
ncbi:2,3-diaminopropionate biosynthesis protein SbnA, partial [Streptomyces sp. NPDC003374]